MTTPDRSIFSDDLNPATLSVLSRFDARRRRLLIFRGLAVALVLVLTTMSLVAACDYFWLLTDGVRALLSVIGYGITAACVWWLAFRHLGRQDTREVARQLESADPRLREDLLSAVELADPESANGSVRFRERLQSIIARRLAGMDIAALLPLRLLKPWLTAAAVMVAIVLVLLAIPQWQVGRRLARAMLPGLAIERASITQLRIIQPDPATGFVPRGDAVAIVVNVSNLSPSALGRDVVLQYYSDDSPMREVAMAPRQKGNAGHENFAANLSIGEQSVNYRVLAGDAITLWHTLTPQPRPSVVSFSKEYVFPAYAKLPNRTETSDHGDLRAVSGSTGVIAVEFDEPVREAIIKYGNRGSQYDLRPVDGSNTRFTTSVPVKTPIQYQIDAVSLQSSLNNPFSPQYSVTPVIDTPPIVRWPQNMSLTRVVSPLEVLELEATATDDLPIDRVLQSFEINGQPAIHQMIEFAEPDRELRLSWQWDLMHPSKANASIKLSSGDIVRTRIVAFDRRGQRADSFSLELLVADEGFDSDRHVRRERLGKLLAEISEWTDQVSTELEPLRESVAEPDRKLIAETGKRIDELRSQSQTHFDAILPEVSTAPNSGQAGVLETIGFSLNFLDTSLDRWFAEADAVLADPRDDTETDHRNLRKLLGNEARSLRDYSRQLGRLAQYTFAEVLTVGVVADGMALSNSLNSLRQTDWVIPNDRYPRYLTVAAGRLAALDELIDRNRERLPETTRKQLDRWTDWSNRWQTELKDMAKDPPEESRMRERIASFDRELTQQVRQTILDRRITPEVSSSLREINRTSILLGQHVESMRQAGQRSVADRDKAEDAADSSDKARLGRSATLRDQQFQMLLRQVLARVDSAESIHRRRVNVDLMFAADLNLIGRAIKNVTDDGYQDYGEQQATEVFSSIANAMKLIETAHRIELVRREIDELMTDEVRVDDSAEARIDHTARLERIPVELEFPLLQLRKLRIDNGSVGLIEQVRYGADYSQARERMSQRQWNDSEILSAESPLRRMQADLQHCLDILEPDVEQARTLIRRYVLSIPELAREAADDADQAQQALPSQVQEEISELVEEATESARETIEALHDFANTNGVDDESLLELSRDADVAAEKLRQSADRVEEELKKQGDAPESSELNDALSELSETLRQTADHFEAAENGEDIAQSRENLRQAEQALGIEQELDERFDRTRAIAEAAQRDPRELLEQLEKELQQNKPMQQELNEIADRSAESTRVDLEQMARDESAINQSLERSDPEIQERKRRAVMELSMLTRTAGMLERELLSMAEKANDWGNVPEANENLKNVRKMIRDATQAAGQIGGESEAMESIMKAAYEMAETLKQAESVLDSAAQAVLQASSQDLHSNENARKQQQRQVEKFREQTRSRKLSQARQNRNDWQRQELSAKQRESQFDRQAKDAERALEDYGNRIDRDPKQRESLEKQIASKQEQLDFAQRGKQAADNTQSFSSERKNQAQQTQRQLETTKQPPLDQLNPAAQLSQQLSGEVKKDLADIRKRLGAIAKQVDAAEQLRSPRNQMESLANRQSRLEEQVTEAAETIARAARHEQRLQDIEQADAISESVQNLIENVIPATEKATQMLQAAIEQSAKSPEANDAVQTAEKKMREAAKQLAGALPKSPSEQSSNRAAAPTPAERQAPGQNAELDDAQAKQLAQTLDELDKTLSQAMQSSQQASQRPDQQASQPSQQPGQAEGQAQAEQPQQANSGQSNQGQANQGQGNSGQPGQTPRSAGEASPTLSAALQAALQAAARQRAQSMQPASGQPGQDSGTPSDQVGQSLAGEPGDQSASSMPPAGSSISIDGIDREGTNWGDLRQQQADDVMESRGSRLPAQYRREIEAYFRAVAKKAGQAE